MAGETATSYYGYTGPGIPDITQVTNPRQPDTNNYLSTNLFQLEITRLPTVTYFCQTVNLPTLTITPVDQPSRFGTYPKEVGGRYSFEDLNVSFIVDENMKNWIEVFRWIESIGVMETEGKTINRADFFSDISLNIMNSAYRDNYRVIFNNAFPISLSGIEFNSTSTDNEPVVATATFTYDSYNISAL